jgi:hypothetical protein
MKHGPGMTDRILELMNGWGYPSGERQTQT